MALEDLALRDGELSILFTDDEHISELNGKYLGKQGPTNVLAFPMTVDESSNEDEAALSVDPEMLGDIVISVDTALQESENLKEDFEKSVSRLLIHGLLHLLHYDHEKSSKEALVMEKEEQRLLALIGDRS